MKANSTKSAVETSPDFIADCLRRILGVEEQMPTYWFINTDAASVKKKKTCDLWFLHGMAFSGGAWKKFGLPLRQLRPADILIMFQNGLGIVGAGRVLKTWDEQPHAEKLIYLEWDYSEYRVRVDWFIDLRTNPVDPRLEFGYIPRGFLKRILEKKDLAKAFISRMDMNAEFKSSEEVDSTSKLQEGEKKTVTVDIHERNPIARKKCIEHWGTKCQVCGFIFEDMYGLIGQNYIHIHHLIPLQSSSGSREVDPVSDLRPVCANCHAIIHKKNPPYTIEEVRKFVQH